MTTAGCSCSYGQAPGGYNMPVQVDADGNLFVAGHSAQPLGTQSLGEAISLGLVPGYTPWSKIGYVPIPATTETDVWSYGGTVTTALRGFLVAT